MGDNEEGTRGTKGIQSIEVGFRLLKPFLEAPGPYTLTKLAAAAGMTPAKAHFYLVSFLRTGLLCRGESGGAYALGPAALYIGLAALGEADVVRAAQDPMLGLRDKLGLPLFLSVAAVNGPTIVQSLSGARSNAWGMRVGSVLSPLTATGRALLAYEPVREQRAVVDRVLASAGPDDPWRDASTGDILDLLARIRRTGISPKSGAVVPGFGSIAAAIFDHEGRAVAALTVIGDETSHDDGFENRFGPAVLETVRAITHSIGGGDRAER